MKKGKWLASLFAPGVLIAIAVITAAAATIATIVIVQNNNDDTDIVSEPNTVLVPESAPTTDNNAIEISNDGEVSKLESPEGGGSVSITYSTEVNVSLANSNVSVYFENPAQSNQNMVLQVILTQNETEKYLVSQSETLEAGYLLRTMTLDESIKSMLGEGSYKGLLNILYFNPETGEKAVVNTNIPINITVSK